MDSVKRNTTIDFVRIIASFFVLICHVHFPAPYKVSSMAVARFAVPFFYMVSGWFLFSPEDSREVIQKRIKKVIGFAARFCLMGILLYAVVNSIACLIIGKEIFYWLFEIIKPDALVALFVFNYAEFLCPVMWYLFAYVYVLAIIFAVIRIGSINKAYFLIPVLLTANLVLADVFPMLRWYHLGNWLFTALPFVLFGQYLRNKRGIFDRLSEWILWLMIVSGIVMAIAESMFYHEHIIYFGTLFMAFGIFGLTIKGADKDWPGPVAEFGRKCTPIIFLIHFAIRKLIYAVFGLISEGIIAYLMPFIVYIIASLIAILIVLIKNNMAADSKAKAAT